MESMQEGTYGSVMGAPGSLQGSVLNSCLERSILVRVEVSLIAIRGVLFH